MRVRLELDLTDAVASLVVPDDGPPFLLLATLATAVAEVQLVPAMDPVASVAALWMLADAADGLSARLRGRHRA